MVKRFSKKQGSKQGVILLTVVLILAMAVIFISACMVMTQATRNRLYWKAEQSQARLTVTSAAEAFYQALEVGDFQEGQLKKLAVAGASGILMTAKDASGNYLPGMSTDLENCTKLSLKAKDANCSEIYAYLVTTIDGETEKVKITFKVKKKSKVYGLFGNPVDYNGNVTNLNYHDFGYNLNGGGQPDDNFMVVRDGAYMQDSTSKIWSGFVFTSGTVGKFQVSMQGTESDFVFLGDSKLGLEATLDSSTNSWFFVNPSGNTDALATDIMVNTMKASGQVVFANRNINKNLTNFDSPVYQISLDSNYNVTASELKGGTAVSDPSSMNDKTSKYASKDFTDSIGEFPSTEIAFAKISYGDSTLPKEAPSEATGMTLAEFENKYATKDPSTPKIVGDDNGDLVPDTVCIRIYGGGGIGGNDAADPSCVFLLDGSTNYFIYFQGSGNQYNLCRCTFAVVNPTSSCNQIFVLENGVDLKISDEWSSSTGYGFLSVSRDTNSASAASYADYLLNNNLVDEMTKSSPAGGSFSTYYDSVKKPTIYMFGAGDNEVYMQPGAVFEGYLGLFNPADSTTKSGVQCYNTSQYIYGRMMFDWFNTADGGDVNMPYCPGPDTGGSKPDVELYKFGYDVVSVDYYYVD